MSTNKSQHFVPRFYLKNFSNQKNGKTISLFNIGKEIFIPSASIKHESCLPFFYGTDRVVENNLSILESIFAKLISDIIKLKKLPSPYSKEHFLLLLFIISAASRTEYSAEAMNETMDKTFKTIYKEDPRFKDFIQDFKIGIQNPATYSMGISLQIVPIIFDLEFKLLENKTSTAFITSDNPLVKYNQFLEFKKAFGAITGYGVKGIQIMIPINPNNYIILFDSSVYKIGDRKQKIIPINDLKDIDSLNLLQFISALKNVYFNDTINENYISDLFSLGKKHLRTRKANLLESPIYYDSNGNKRKQFATFSEDIKIKLNLSFIKILKKSKKYDLGNKLVHVRNENIIKISDLISKKFEPENK